MANDTRESLAVGIANTIASFEGKTFGSAGADREYILNLYSEVFAAIDGKREVGTTTAEATPTPLLRATAHTATAHTGYTRAQLSRMAPGRKTRCVLLDL